MKFSEKFFLGFCFMFTFGAIVTSVVYCSSQQNKEYSWHPNVETISKKKDIDKVFNLVKQDEKFVIESLVNEDDITEIRIPSFVIDKNKVVPLDISKEFINLLASKKNQVKSLTIGGNVNLELLKNNGKGAYFDKLESLEIENGIKEIPPYLFVTPTLKTIKLPNSIETISDQAFRNTSIEEIELPDTIQNLSSQCFAFNKNLKKATFRRVDGKIPSNLITIGSAVFQGTALSSFVFPKSLKNVNFEFSKNDYRFFMFYECNELKEISSTKEVKDKFFSIISFPEYITSKKIQWKI